MMARSRLIAVLAAASLASTAWGVPVEPRKLAEDCDGESLAEDLVEVGSGVVCGIVIGLALGVGGTLLYQRRQNELADNQRLVGGGIEATERL